MKTILLLLAIFFFYTAAHAAQATFHFTGEINGVPLSGSYTFTMGSTIPNAYFSQGAPTGLYLHAENGIGPKNGYGDVIVAATVNWTEQGTLLPDPFVPMGPRNGIALADYATGRIDYHDYYAVTIPLVGLTGYDYFGLSLVDETNRLLTDTALPSFPPSLNLATVAHVGLYNRVTVALASGTLTSLIHTPLPASVVLFVGGLVFLACWRGRKRMPCFRQ